MSAQTPRYIVDLLSAVVDSTETALGFTIHYTYGSYAEIIEKLKVMTETPSDTVPKYPIIALITDVRERKGLPNTSLYSEVNCNLVIAIDTRSDIYAEDRMATAGNFKTKLYPIYEEFLYQLYLCHKFDIDDEREIQHDKYDRLNFGRTQAFIESGMGVDFIDAIEIREMVLPVKNYSCLTINSF